METPSFRFKLDRDFQLTQDPLVLGHEDWEGRRIAMLDNGFAMWAPVRSTFEFDEPAVIVDVVLDVEDQRPVVVEYTVRRKPGGPPVEFVARDAVRGVSLRDLMAEAMIWQVLEPVADTTGSITFDTGEVKWRPVRSIGKLDAITSGTRSRRLPMSDERLQATAAAFLDGGIDAVVNLDGWQCEMRQAQRAVKAARDRGFLPTSEES